MRICRPLFGHDSFPAIFVPVPNLHVGILIRELRECQSPPDRVVRAERAQRLVHARETQVGEGH